MGSQNVSSRPFAFNITVDDAVISNAGEFNGKTEIIPTSVALM